MTASVNHLVACADVQPLSRFPIHNYVLTRPQLREFFDVRLRGFEVFRALDQMKAPIVACLEYGKRRLHPGTPIASTGDSSASIIGPRTQQIHVGAIFWEVGLGVRCHACRTQPQNRRDKLMPEFCLIQQGRRTEAFSTHARYFVIVAAGK
jgi:hypothetical protein